MSGNVIVPGAASDIEDGLMKAFTSASIRNDYAGVVALAKELRKRGIVEKADNTSSTLIVTGTVGEIKSGLAGAFKNASEASDYTYAAEIAKELRKYEEAEDRKKKRDAGPFMPSAG